MKRFIVSAVFALFITGWVQPAVSDQTSRKRLASILGRFSSEPDVKQVQKAAMRYAQLHPEETEYWILRSRLSGLVPAVKVGIDRGLERDESLDQAWDDADEFGVDTDNDFSLDCSAQWDLPRLVFDADEIRVVRELTSRVEKRISLLTMVTRMYYERRRLQIQMIIEPPSDIKESADIDLRLEELTATLDAMTGGLYSGKKGKHGH